MTVRICKTGWPIYSPLYYFGTFIKKREKVILRKREIDDKAAR